MAERRSCRRCGCTEDRACPGGGCSWVGPRACSQCFVFYWTRSRGISVWNAAASDVLHAFLPHGIPKGFWKGITSNTRGSWHEQLEQLWAHKEGLA